MSDAVRTSALLSISDLMSIPDARSEAVSPDGELIAYLSNESGTHQIWLRDLPRGERRKLTDMPERIGAIAFSPVSRDLIFTMDCGGDERHQLWLLSDAHGEPEPLTQDLTTYHAWGCWAPDGTRIAYTSNERDKTVMDVMVTELTTRSTQRVIKGAGWCDVLCFTPDGQGLVVRGSDRSTMDQDLWRLDIASGARRLLMGQDDGGGATAILSVRFTSDGRQLFILCDRDEGFHALCLLDLESGELTTHARIAGQDIELFALSAEQTKLAYVSNDRGYSRLHLRAGLDGPADEVALPAPGVVTSLRFLTDGSGLVMSFETPQHPSAIWRYDLETRRFDLLTKEISVDAPADALVAPEVVEFSSFDGTKVPAFVYRPRHPARRA